MATRYGNVYRGYGRPWKNRHAYARKLLLSRVGDPEQQSGGSSSQKHKRILIVDDEENILRVIHRVLSADGYDKDSIECVGTRAEALFLLEYWKDKGEHCDLVISDTQMPGPMDLLAFREKVKKLSPDTPFLLLSGAAEELKEEKKVADAFLPKPFMVEDFRVMVKGLIGYTLF